MIGVRSPRLQNTTVQVVAVVVTLEPVCIT